MQQLEFEFTYDELELPIGYTPKPIEKPCECGCSMVGCMKHSDYCPLYVPEEVTYEP